MKEIIDELISLNITIRVHQNELKVEGPREKITTQIIGKIKANKDSLIEYLLSLRTNEYLIGEIPIGPEGSHYILSSSQQRLWILSQLQEVDGAFYNTYGAWIFLGKLDVAALQEALQTLVERHSILRTLFHKNPKGQVVQSILTDGKGASRIIYHDLREIGGNDLKAMDLLGDEIRRPFVLSEGPLMRPTLVQLEEEKFFFTYVMHHIISDGWSMNVLINELLILYTAFVSGKPHQLSPLKIQYKDYALWQREQLSVEKLREHEAYWIKQFAGELPLLDIQTDRLRPLSRSGRGGSVASVVDKKLVEGLLKLSRKAGCSLFMGLTGLVNTLLYRYTGQEDIVIGSPVAGRDHEDLQDQIGLYVNMLALRFRFTGNIDFIKLLYHVKKIVLEAYEHQVYPFDELVNVLNTSRDISRNPLFDVAVTLQNGNGGLNTAVADNSSGGIGISELKGLENPISRYDLAFDFKEKEDGFHAVIEYNEDIFNKASAARLLMHLVQIWQAVINDSAQPLKELDYLNQGEKRQLLVGFNSTVKNYPLNVHPLSILDKVVAEFPGNIAVIDQYKSLSYSVLDVLSESLAEYFVGVKQLLPGDRVGIIMDKSVYAIVTMIAIMKAKLVYVPVNPLDVVDRLRYIFSDASVKMICSDKNYQDLARRIVLDMPFVEVITLDAVLLDALPFKSRISRPLLGDLAYIIYTSGSTGYPKGVMVSYEGLVNVAFDHIERLPIGHGDKVFQFIALSFDGSVLDIFMTLLAGACLVMPSREILADAGICSRFIADTKTDIATFTPSYFRFLSGDPLPGVKIMLSAGEIIDVAVARYYSRDRFFFNAYGPTEATVNAALHRVTMADLDRKGFVPIGRPAANKKIVILDENMQLQPVGVPGEICIWGNGLAIGYLNQPELTAIKFVDNPFEPGARLYKTGDMGLWNQDGSVVYKGRKDDQVKVRGYRIEMGEIEFALDAHPAIGKSAVLCVDGDSGEKDLIAFYVPDQIEGYTIKKILECEHMSVPANASLFETKSGISMYANSQSELQLLHREIVEDRIYLRNGIVIPDGGCVLDVGANIGMFSVLSRIMVKDLRIYAFEPLPPTFKLLELNTGLYGGNIKLFNYGLSDREETATFTFYPNVAALSSRYTDKSLAIDTVMKFIKGSDQYSKEMISEGELGDLLESRLITECYECRLRTISQVIAENNITKIDLLKIDVEQAELDVLIGIEAVDWGKIDQIIIEVHGDRNRVKEVTSLLAERGFMMHVEKNSDLAYTDLYNVYARSNSFCGDEEDNLSHLKTDNFSRYSVNLIRREIEGFIRKRIPVYMMPSRLIAIDKMPMINGKIDKNALAKRDDVKAIESNYVAPTNEIERALVKIWSEVLDLDERKIGIKDSFFNLGGHSLNAMRVIARLHEQFEVDVELTTFFNQPFIGPLAVEIENIQWVRKAKLDRPVVDRRSI